MMLQEPNTWVVVVGSREPARPVPLTRRVVRASNGGRVTHRSLC